MKLEGRIKYMGKLDRVSVEDQTLTIQGWIAARGAGNLTGLNASVCGKICRSIEQVLHMPSPDVQAVFPELDHSDRCRFLFRATLPEGVPSATRDLLLAVEPSFAREAGDRLWYTLAQSLPDPPRALVKLIGDGLHDASLEFLGHFVNKGRLQPSDNVLDVGCGVGRMAYGLVNYLDSAARYEGFDIVPDLISWAQRNISTRYPNFHFRQAPIYNSFYNPSGHLKPTEFIFPYPNASFDFVFLTSVFTHMPGDVIRHYMHEIRRVLKLGGHCVMTCFLLNSESIPLIHSGKSKLDLSHPRGDGKTADPRNPDYAVGFEEGLFTDWLKTEGLMVADTLYGSWCGRDDHVSYQDLVFVQG
jgi:SAM-dependent methyltransferase